MENHDAEGVELEAKENPPAAVRNAEAAEEEHDDDVKKEVSFQNKVEVADILTPMTQGPAEVRIEDIQSPQEEEPAPVPAAEDETMGQLIREGDDLNYMERRRAAEPQVIRRMKKVDIETGKKTLREMRAEPVWDFKDPMNPVERKKATVQALAQDKSADDGVPQYRLRSRICDRKYVMRKEHYLVKQYLHWTFRASFIDLIISDFIIFGLLCLAWAACIYLGALVSPRCFVVAGTPLSEIEDWKENFFFMDALQLSWTTFSTVGYGVVYPQVNKGSVSARPDCFVFSFMVTLESFVGILFGAFCGSIIFGKIARIQSIASIQWSDPMVIRFGPGVVEPKPEVKSAESDSDSDKDSDEEDDAGDIKDEEKKSDDIEGSMRDPLENSARSQKSGGSGKGSKRVKFPPPVLEFRVVNTLNYQQGGEIMNASLNVFASTEASKSMESLEMSAESTNSSTLAAAKLLKMSFELTQKTGRAIKKTKDVTSSVLHRSTAAASKRSGSIVQKVNRAIARPSILGGAKSKAPGSRGESIDETSVSSDVGSEMEPFNRADAQQHAIQRELAMASLFAASSNKHIPVDEGSGLVPRRIFSKMEIETDTHPFFKRVWNIRHVLDENSPLLSAKVKRIMQKNNGKWPQDICNASFIRKNIHFHQIIVQLSGTHNASGSDVFGMHIYEFKSLNIGYRFAQCLNADEEGKLYLDMDLLNDVQEQRGGGGEAIRGYLVDEFGGAVLDDDGNVTSPTDSRDEDMIPGMA